jgi:hypothetical protein
VGAANGATALLPHGQVAHLAIDEVWAAVQAEVPVLVPGVVRSTGVLDAVLEQVFTAVAGVAGPRAVERLRVEGIERLHEVCTREQLGAVLDVVDDRLRVPGVGFRLEHALVSATAPALGNRYFARVRLLVRAMVPSSAIEADVDAGRFVGRLHPHAPHRDQEYTSPRRSVSYWGALGRVRAENSMALAPSTDVDAPPIIPVLDAGDLLLFADRILHATIPNTTDETRVVVQFRMTAGRFVRYGDGTNFHPYADARIAGTRFAPAATLQSYVTAAAVRSWWAQHRPRR